MPRRRDDHPPARRSLLRDLACLAVEHVAPAVVYEVGAALRERAERRHAAAHPPPAAPPAPKP